MAQSTAMRRLRKEYADLRKDPVFPGIWVEPLESNFLHAHFLLSGPVFEDTPYEGGVYHGVLKFPSAYPLRPPSVIIYTPSGRFQPNVKICYSFSDFHPELWNPMWSIRTILTGLVSFMNSEELTTGGMEASTEYRVETARNSLRHCMEVDEVSKTLFDKQLKAIDHERCSALEDQWPPPRKDKETTPPSAEVVPKMCRLRSSERTEKARSSATNDKKGDQSDKPSAAEDFSKNALKNRKKREKEKRRKLAQTFVDQLRTQIPEFVGTVAKSLCAKGIDLSDCTPDHVCWRTQTLEEYNSLVTALRASESLLTLLIEAEVGGRLISTFRLAEAIHVMNGRHSIALVEIPAPKDGRHYSRGLEHVEFVIPSTGTISPENDAFQRQHLQQWMDKYESLNWNTKALSKSINPDVSLSLDSACCVKFHLVSLEKVIESEKIRDHIDLQE